MEFFTTLLFYWLPPKLKKKAGGHALGPTRTRQNSHRTTDTRLHYLVHKAYLDRAVDNDTA